MANKISAGMFATFPSNAWPVQGIPRRLGLEGSRGFKSPCTFVAVPSHRLFESSWSNGIADQNSLDALSTSPQAGFLNRSEPVDPVGNAWWLGGNMNTAALLG